MPTITFKADDSFYKSLKLVAERRGISVSAYIKLNLSEVLRRDLSELTENGLTVEKERQILSAIEQNDGKTYDSLNDFFDDLTE